MLPNIRVMLVDDHSIVHVGITGIMEAFDGIELIGEAASGEVAVTMAKELQPDVILMDLRLPEMDGIETTRQIKTLYPEIQVIVLTSYENTADIQKALSAGAVGYLLKNVSATELESAIRSAAQGHKTLAPEAAQALIEYSHIKEVAGKNLTDREIEVLGFLAQGFSNSQIAAKLVVSPFTVKAHVSNILGKLGVNTRAEAAAYAVQHHLVQLD